MDDDAASAARALLAICAAATEAKPQLNRRSSSSRREESRQQDFEYGSEGEEEGNGRRKKRRKSKAGPYDPSEADMPPALDDEARRLRMNHLRRCNEDMRILMLGWRAVEIGGGGSKPAHKVYEHPEHGRVNSKKEIFRIHRGTPPPRPQPSRARANGFGRARPFFSPAGDFSSHTLPKLPLPPSTCVHAGEKIDFSTQAAVTVHEHVRHTRAVLPPIGSTLSLQASVEDIVEGRTAEQIQEDEMMAAKANTMSSMLAAAAALGGDELSPSPRPGAVAPSHLQHNYTLVGQQSMPLPEGLKLAPSCPPPVPLSAVMPSSAPLQRNDSLRSEAPTMPSLSRNDSLTSPPLQCPRPAPAKKPEPYQQEAAKKLMSETSLLAWGEMMAQGLEGGEGVPTEGGEGLQSELSPQTCGKRPHVSTWPPVQPVQPQQPIA